jgi:hypothetical protein
MVSTDPDDVAKASLHIFNEFADAVVTQVPHGNGTRLRVTAPRAGRESLIDAVVLEALASVSPEHLTAILVSTVPGNDIPHLHEHSAGNDRS